MSLRRTQRQLPTRLHKANIYINLNNNKINHNRYNCYRYVYIDSIKIVLYQDHLAQSVENFSCNPKVPGSIPALDFVNLLLKLYFPICLTTAWWHDIIKNAIFRLFVFINMWFLKLSNKAHFTNVSYRIKSNEY